MYGLPRSAMNALSMYGILQRSNKMALSIWWSKLVFWHRELLGTSEVGILVNTYVYSMISHNQVTDSLSALEGIIQFCFVYIFTLMPLTFHPEHPFQGVPKGSFYHQQSFWCQSKKIKSLAPLALWIAAFTECTWPQMQIAIKQIIYSH